MSELWGVVRMTEKHDQTEPSVESSGDSIVAEINGDSIEADWKDMERLAHDILKEADNHKTDLEKIKQISGAHVRFKCDNCGFSLEYEYVRDMRDRGPSPQQHADYPDDDCTVEDCGYEAFCPRHGTIPMHYDECDGCADARNVMNR